MPSKLGFGIFVGVVPGMLIAVTAIDLYLTFRRRPPVGHYVHEFMIDYPWFAGMLALLFGGMIAHFFLHITHG